MNCLDQQWLKYYYTVLEIRGDLMPVGYVVDMLRRYASGQVAMIIWANLLGNYGSETMG